jgi:hypothetical protein
MTVNRQNRRNEVSLIVGNLAAAIAAKNEREAIVPFQQQHIAGDGIVFNYEMNQRLLVVTAITN